MCVCVFEIWVCDYCFLAPVYVSVEKCPFYFYLVEILVLVELYTYKLKILQKFKKWERCRGRYYYVLKILPTNCFFFLFIEN